MSKETEEQLKREIADIEKQLERKKSALEEISSPSFSKGEIVVVVDGGLLLDDNSFGVVVGSCNNGGERLVCVLGTLDGNIKTSNIYAKRLRLARFGCFDMAYTIQNMFDMPKPIEIMRCNMGASR